MIYRYTGDTFVPLFKLHPTIGNNWTIYADGDFPCTSNELPNNEEVSITGEGTSPILIGNINHKLI